MTNSTWRVVYEAREPFWPTPVHSAGQVLDFGPRLPRVVPNAGVLVLNDAFVHVEDGWIEVPEGFILHEHSWYGDHMLDESGLASSNERPSSEPAVCLEGTTLTLLTDWSSVYGHLLYDSLPRLHLFEAAGYSMEQVDHVLCAAVPRLRTLLRELGVPPEKCVWVDSGPSYIVRQLIAPTFPGVRRALQPWAARFLRGRLLPDRSPPSNVRSLVSVWRRSQVSGSPGRSVLRHRERKRPARRCIYVQRRSDRTLTNSDEVERLFEQAGFDLIDPILSDEDPRLVFANADVVVGAHGSALADIVFCRPGTSVLELVPTDHVYPYWYCASVAAQIDYSYLACRSTSHRPSDALGPSPYDFTVDIGELSTALDRLLASPGM
jgi:hypothetical protein